MGRAPSEGYASASQLLGARWPSWLFAEPKAEGYATRRRTVGKQPTTLAQLGLPREATARALAPSLSTRARRPQ